MKNWPVQHRNLLAALVCVVLACVLVLFLVFRPKAGDVAVARVALKDMQERLRRLTAECDDNAPDVQRLCQQLD